MSCRMLKDNRCRLELYDGTPTAADCDACEFYDGPIRGAGDLVAKVTQATGIAKAVQTITKGNCGCGKRRAALNKALPRGGRHAEQADNREE